MSFYFVTITAYAKKLFIGEDDLDEVIKWLRMNKVVFTNIVYENSGMYNQLHVHATATIPKGFRWRNYTNYGFGNRRICFRIYWKRVFNNVGVIRYMNKDHNKPITQGHLQNILSRYWSNHYFNADTECFEKDRAG